MTELSGETEAIVLVKAAPHASSKHGETICCAGIAVVGGWLRLYPVSFRHLHDAQKFARWDKIRFAWRRPRDDQRPESRRVDHESLEIVGALPKAERERFLSRYEVTSLAAETEAGKTLALIRPRELRFIIERKPSDEIERERAERENLHAQNELFAVRRLVPHDPCPYRFKYAYHIDDGERTGTCQDWETEATFFHWRTQYGEERALNDMQHVFGEEYPKRGMAFVMGTHSRRPGQWLIVGVVRFDVIRQGSML